MKHKFEKTTDLQALIPPETECDMSQDAGVRLCVCVCVSDLTRRWCTLEGGFLSYYDSKRSSSAMGRVDVTEVVSLDVSSTETMTGAGYEHTHSYDSSLAAAVRSNTSSQTPFQQTLFFTFFTLTNTTGSLSSLHLPVSVCFPSTTA